MATSIYDDQGIRFEYPHDWEDEVSDEGSRTAVTIQSPSGLAFVMVTIDADRPSPADLVEEALAVMRAEYPAMDVSPATETIDGHKAVGQDVEFFSLDMVNSCQIRAFRTPRRTVLVFGQWSEAEAELEEPEAILRAVRRSLEETDS